MTKPRGHNVQGESEVWLRFGIDLDNLADDRVGQASKRIQLGSAGLLTQGLVVTITVSIRTERRVSRGSNDRRGKELDL